MTQTPHLIEVTNLGAAAITLLFAALVARELVRLRRGFPPVAIILTATFVALAVDRLAAPDPVLGYSTAVDAITDVALLVLIGMLLLQARRLARASLATIDEARWRAQEYARARHDYSQLVQHRLANPLTTIIGAAHTLQRDDLDEATHRQLIQSILDAAERTERLGLEPERMGIEEHGLDAVPHVHQIGD